MNSPNNSTWSAEQHEKVIATEDGDRFTWVIPCGNIALPSGRLVVCDPFVSLQPHDNLYVLVPPGNYPVSVTLADVSKNLDRSHIREAYATVRITDGLEAYCQVIPLIRGKMPDPLFGQDKFVGFIVDSGTACFVDDMVIANAMPSAESWYEDVFDNASDDSWFNQMDDPGKIRQGIANIRLPYAANGENIVVIHSGWGDGAYQVIGSFDTANHLLAVHIDFLVIR
jgi:hypothetical protein